jgi:amino acid transporter
MASFFLGDLDMIASLLTMFFLISYAMINMTVFIEKIIRIPSFRPRFGIPLFVPAAGMIWCVRSVPDRPVFCTGFAAFDCGRVYRVQAPQS